jgi:hypothetical protein
LIYIIIGVIILILALILSLILFIPFNISFYLEKRGQNILGYFQVKWLRIRLLRHTIPPEEKEEKKDKEKKERKSSLKDVLNVFRKFIAAFEYLTPIFHAFIKSLKLVKLSLNLNIGFTSPVTTALISGYFWSISSILNMIHPINLSITPDFIENKFDATFDFEINLTLYPTVWALLKAITKKPVRELISSVIKLNQ